LRRRLFAAMVFLALLIALVLPLGWLFWGSSPVATGREFRPSMPIPEGVDVDANRVDDRLDLEIKERFVNGTENMFVNVIVMVRGEAAGAAGTFVGFGGIVITDLWNNALYGFGGRIPFGRIQGFAHSRSDILLVEKEAECNATVDYAARQVGARSYVWNTLGLRGDEASSIAIVDTGVDPSHLDFATGYGLGDFSKKIVGWNDQVTSSSAPFDDIGHGSHCSGLAAGDGFFSVDESGYATATWGANLGRITSAETYLLSGIMVNRTGTVTVSVRWSNVGQATLTSLLLYDGAKSLSTGSWVNLASVATPNEDTWYTFTYNVASTPSGGYDMYHVLGSLTKGSPSPVKEENLYVMFTVTWPYTPPEDGGSAWTGIAPDSKLVGVKVLPGTNIELVGGIDWIVENRMIYHITVASMSLGFDVELTSVDVAVKNLVDSGVCTVVSAGNSGSGANNIYTPSSVDEVLTVAAVNQFDGVTSYSSQGGTSRYIGQTVKPDVAAPGGSFLAVPLFGVDSNYNDADGRWSDWVLDDGAPMQGTSMSAPIVAGAAQILVEALGGFGSWQWTTSQALLPKMLLLMTATETYPNARESGTSPTLERGDKDVHEGYGRINVDAAADAVMQRYVAGTSITDSLGSPPKLSDISVLGQRFCWARNVKLLPGVEYTFTLDVPAGADFDLYLYNTSGTSFGEPVILAKSTLTELGEDESFVYTPPFYGAYYVVVKRAREDTSGGQFTLTSTPGQKPHLLLNVEPSQTFYSQGQAVTFEVTVLNQLAPALDSTLTLTITGPNSYYLYDFQRIAIATDEVKDYGFSWVVPDSAGKYVVEVGLVPAQLTAYDAAWLEVD
jgi:subtilisin family serine protease